MCAVCAGQDDDDGKFYAVYPGDDHDMFGEDEIVDISQRALSDEEEKGQSALSLEPLSSSEPETEIDFLPSSSPPECGMITPF